MAAFDRTLTRRSLLGAAAALASTTLVACGRPGPSSGGPIALNLQAPFDTALWSEMVPRFEAQNPGLRLNVAPAPKPGSPSLAGALVSGNGPDVFWDDDPARYLGTPLALDLSPLISASGYPLTDFGSAILAAYRYGGGLYMLPRTVSPSVYAARTDIWAGAGLELPSGTYTATDLANLWRQLSTAGRIVPGQLVWSPSSTFYLNGWGAHEVDPANAARCALGSAAAVACGQWMWNRFWVDGSAQGLQGQFASASFKAGTLAMQVVDCAGLPAFAAAAEGVPWSLVPFPNWPVRQATAAATDFFAISAASHHPEQAWILLQFVCSTAWQQAAIGTLLVCPSRRSLWEQYVAQVPRILPALKGQDIALYAQSVQGDWALPPEQFRHQAAAQPLLQSFWQKIFGPGSTVGVRQGFAALAAAIDTAEQAPA